MEYNRPDQQKFDYERGRTGGAADSYYSGAPSGQAGYPPNQHGNDGPDGERGLMGALAGGAAGAYGGHQVGGKMTGHSKMSTVIGAVAGAIAGHKLQDTVSDWRADKKEENKHKYDHDYDHNHDNDHGHGYDHNHGDYGHDSHGSYGYQQSENRSMGNYAGNYSQSAKDVYLDAYGDYNLTAECRGKDGSYHRSTISLNRILENDHGSFRWSSGVGQTMTIQQGDTLRSVAARFNCSFEDIAHINNIQNPDMVYAGQVIQIPGGSAGFGASAQNVRLLDNGHRLEAELRRDDGNWNTSSIILDERISNDNGSLKLL